MPKKIIQLKKLSKNFSHESGIIKVLKEVDLEISSGTTVAIVGPSGSGKSTLLSLIAGLDKASSGSLEVISQNIKDKNEEERAVFRAKNIGMVFQSFHLLSHLTALENAALPLILQKNSQALEQAKNLMKKVNLGHRLDHLPKDLSGGEAQRVALVRAIIHEPEIILADEPSGNLDTKSGKIVQDLLFNFVKERKKTLLLVTHNTDWASKCDHQYQINDGRIS